MGDGGGEFGADLFEKWKLIFEAGERINDALAEFSRILHDAAGALAIIIANVWDSGDGSGAGDDQRSETKIFGEATFGIGEMIGFEKLGAIAIKPGIFGVVTVGEERKGGGTRQRGKTRFGAWN